MQKSNMPPTGGQRLRRLFLMALMVVLAGCSSLRLAYNNGDTLLYWWLDGYVDLDSDQKGSVKEDIDQLFHWHRKTQLNDYIQLLQTGQRQLAGNPGRDDLLKDFDQIKDRTQKLLIKAAPELADLARSLKPEQIANMQAKFDKTNADFRKKNMRGSREDQQEFRYKKSMEQFKLWFGSFSNEQEAQIRKASDARPLDNQIWLDERIRRQKGVLALLQKVQHDKLSKEATVAQLEALIKASFTRLDKSEHKQFFDASEQGTADLILAVIKVATAAQKAHAQKRMQGWIDDFRSLAAEVR